MGLFDIGNTDIINKLSGTDNPTYNPVDLDQGTKGLIQGSIDRAQQPYVSTDIRKNAAPFMPSQKDGLLSAPGTGQAIANKYSQLAGEKLEGLQTLQGKTDKEHEFARTGMAMDNAMKQQQVQNQNYEAYLQQIKNENQVRAETMNTILGGAAQVGGAAAGGMGGGGGGGKPKQGMNGNGNGGGGNSYGGESYGGGLGSIA